jgi:hypothetical protein
MQHLEVSGAVWPVCGSLGVKRLNDIDINTDFDGGGGGGGGGSGGNS